MKIAIIHNLPDVIKKTLDTISDDEVLEISEAIKDVLKNTVDIYKFDASIISKLKEYDVVFNLAEKTYGSNYEEDEIARSLEENTIKFTGSGSKTLQLTMDKGIIKKKLIESGIRTPGYLVTDDWKEVNLKFPLIVKPAKEHGSIGITKSSYVNSKEELAKKLGEVKQKYKQKSVVEEFIEGREINAAVLGREVLPFSEILFDLPKGEPTIVTYDAKWDEGSLAYSGTVGTCPADLPKNIEDEIKDMTIRVFDSFGCSGYARVDFRIRDDVPYVIDVNPNPCINPNGSGFVRSAKAAGYDYEKVIRKIIGCGMKRIINTAP